MKTLKSVLTQGLKMASSIRLLAFVAMLALSSIAQAAEQKITTYYHVDELGTPIAATNESGETLWRNFNSPYGVRYTKPNLEGAVDAEGANYESTGESTAALNRIGFTGHVEDKIDGRQLIYMQARFYDPVIGRFLSPDPVGFSTGNPMTFNRYDYANSNPLIFIDPNGESVVEIATEILPAAGRSFAGLAAWGMGHLNGDQHLINAALDGMAAQTSDNLFALASILAPPGTGAARRAENLVDKVDVPGSEKLYRGVPATSASSKASDARAGIANPRGTALDDKSLEKHVRGDHVNAGVTSWTTDRAAAQKFSGANGTILEVDAANVADKVVSRPNIEKYAHEAEVLLRGTIQGAVTKP